MCAGVAAALLRCRVRRESFECEMPVAAIGPGKCERIALRTDRRSSGRSVSAAMEIRFRAAGRSRAETTEGSNPKGRLPNRRAFGKNGMAEMRFWGRSVVRKRLTAFLTDENVSKPILFVSDGPTSGLHFLDIRKLKEGSRFRSEERGVVSGRSSRRLRFFGSVDARGGSCDFVVEGVFRREARFGCVGVSFRATRAASQNSLVPPVSFDDGIAYTASERGRLSSCSGACSSQEYSLRKEASDDGRFPHAKPHAAAPRKRHERRFPPSPGTALQRTLPRVCRERGHRKERVGTVAAILNFWKGVIKNRFFMLYLRNGAFSLGRRRAEAGRAPERENGYLT